MVVGLWLHTDLVESEARLAKRQASRASATTDPVGFKMEDRGEGEVGERQGRR